MITCCPRTSESRAARTRPTVSVETLRCCQLLEALRPPIAEPIAVADLASRLRPDRALDRILSLWNLGALLAVPLGPDEGGVFWVARPDARAFASSEIAAAARWAKRLADASTGQQSSADRQRRLQRLDALAEVLPALGTADVFSALSSVAHRVLPHDSAVVGVYGGDRRASRLDALTTASAWTLAHADDEPRRAALGTAARAWAKTHVEWRLVTAAYDALYASLLELGP